MVFRRLLKDPRFQDEIENQLRNPGEDNDIMPGLVPVGDTGLYRTPDEPADPTDCARYPDSPFCGGIPLTLTPIGLDPEIIDDGCNIGIRLNPAIAFIRLPPVAIVYRRPECRTPPPDIQKVSSIDTCIAIDCFGGYVTIGYSGTFWASEDYGDDGVPGVFYDNDNEDVTNLPEVQGSPNLRRGIKEVIIPYFQDIKFCYHKRYIGLDFGIVNDQGGMFSPSQETFGIEDYPIKNKQRLYRYASFVRGTYPPSEREGGRGILEFTYLSSNWYLDDIKIEYIRCSLDKPPPPPKDICCMPQCCSSPDNDLLKILLKRIKKISDVVGVDRFPAEFPQRLTYPNAKGSEKVKDLVELLAFQIKQVDRAVGYLPQKIKVADTNPGLAGNQSVEVEIHSFADFCKEILQYVIDTEGDGDVTNNMLVRALYELGFIHQGVVQGNAMLDATVDHLDFKHKWKKIRVPFAFDPYAGQKGKVGQGFDKQQNSNDNKTEEAVEELLPKLLNNTEVDIRILVNDEKKSLNDLLQDIKRDTAMAAAAVAEESTPKRLEQLVAAAQLMLQVQSAIDRRNMRQALIAGNLKSRKIKR